MNPFQGILATAFVLMLAAAVVEAIDLRRPSTETRRLARRLATIAAVASGAAFLWLVTRFIVVDLSLEYVFLYTSTQTPLWYRIAGAWTGREGSLLLWAAYLAGLAAVMARRRTDVMADDATARSWTRFFMFAVTTAFLLAVARQGTFAATDPFFLSGRPGGVGLNPTLRSPFMLIHPPLMFFAYALTTVPLAAGLAHLVSGTGRWSHIATPVSRLGWLVYTFAMGLGGMWAYYTLGFGGYWAWDPVEVANFLPWLALTIYLHVQLHHSQHGRYAAIGPFFALLPFLLTVFSAVSTRSGLWVSVHAFTDPSNAFDPDAASRLLGILDLDPSLTPYFAILMGTLLAGLAFWVRRTALDHDVLAGYSRIVAGVLSAASLAFWVAPIESLSMVLEAASVIAGGRTGLGALGLLLLTAVMAAAPVLFAPEEAPGSTGRRWGLKELLFGSVLALGLGLLVVFLWHMAAVNGWDTAFWEARVPWLVTPIGLLLVTLFLHAHRGRRNALVAAAATLVAGLAAFLVWGLGAYSMVLAIGVLAAGVDKMVAVAFVGPLRRRIAALLLWLAAVADLVFWVSPPTIGWLDWTPRWPMQVPFIVASMVAVWGAHRFGSGHRVRWPFWLAAVLGGFWAALILAADGLILAWGDTMDQRPRRARWRPVAVYGIHVVVGMLFVGYAASTYFDDAASGDLAVGETIMVAGEPVRFEGAQMVAAAGSPWADEIRPVFTSQGRSIEGILYWEPQTGSHYPLPNTLRSWDGDLYVSVEAVCLDGSGECEAPGDWVQAYDASPRVSGGADVQQVRVQLIWLPGVSLVWTSLLLFAGYGALLLWARPETRPSTSASSRSS